MRKIYATYAKYGVYVGETQVADAYHDHMLHSYERAQNLFNEVDDECGAYDEFPMEDLLDALNDELKYINHFKKIHILLATIPTTI